MARTTRQFTVSQSDLSLHACKDHYATSKNKSSGRHTDDLIFLIPVGRVTRGLNLKLVSRVRVCVDVSMVWLSKKTRSFHRRERCAMEFDCFHYSFHVTYLHCYLLYAHAGPRLQLLQVSLQPWYAAFPGWHSSDHKDGRKLSQRQLRSCPLTSKRTALSSSHSSVQAPQVSGQTV